jgi:hypothetical protein
VLVAEGPLEQHLVGGAFDQDELAGEHDAKRVEPREALEVAHGAFRDVREGRGLPRVQEPELVET